MNRVRISAIAAVGKNRELGTKNQLSWRIKDDLKRVKNLTTGHPIIMGRKTYESIGHPLPNRTNIIVTRDLTFTSEGCVVVHSVNEAIAKATNFNHEEIFIFGGAEIYAQAFPFIDRLYLTYIHAADSKADVFFPDYSEFTHIIECEVRQTDGLTYEWMTLER